MLDKRKISVFVKIDNTNFLCYCVDACNTFEAIEKVKREHPVFYYCPYDDDFLKDENKNFVIF